MFTRRVTRRDLLQNTGAMMILASLAEAVPGPGVNVKALLEQKIGDIQNPLVTMEVVEFGPGVQSTPHRHPGPVFGYVLEGGAAAVHVLARNPSTTNPVRFLAVIVGKQGSPSVLPK